MLIYKDTVKKIMKSIRKIRRFFRNNGMREQDLDYRLSEISDIYNDKIFDSAAFIRSCKSALDKAEESWNEDVTDWKDIDKETYNIYEVLKKAFEPISQYFDMNYEELYKIDPPHYDNSFERRLKRQFESKPNTKLHKNLKIINEDFEFYKTPSGKIGVDKVITTTSKSGKTFKDGSDNKGDTSKAVKRIPLSKMSDEDKELAKAAYAVLKKDGSIKNVDKKFKTDPKPDVVMKSDGTHADIYYDDNTDGEPDEKDVRLVASRKRTAYQRLHGLKEYTNNIDLLNVSNHIDEVYELAEGNLPKNNSVFKYIDYIFNNWLENDGWFDEEDNENVDSLTFTKIKCLRNKLSDVESTDYLHYGDLYDQIYDLLFGNTLIEKVGSSDEYSIYIYWESKGQWLPVDENGSTNGDSLVFSSKKEAIKDPVIEILKSKVNKIKIAPANWNGKK